VHHQFTLVSVFSVGCNRTDRAMCQCPSSIAGVNGSMTVSTELDSCRKGTLSGNMNQVSAGYKSQDYRVSQRGRSVMLPSVSLRTAPCNGRHCALVIFSVKFALRSEAADC